MFEVNPSGYIFLPGGPWYGYAFVTRFLTAKPLKLVGYFSVPVFNQVAVAGFDLIPHQWLVVAQTTFEQVHFRLFRNILLYNFARQ
jgi:hypothetical protein